MEEQIILFETAKLAKEKGFDLYTLHAYINGEFFDNEPQPNGYDGWDIPESKNWNRLGWLYTKDGSGCFGCVEIEGNSYFKACSAPTQSLLQKWLREKHYIFCEIKVGLQHEDFMFSSYITTKNNRGYNFRSSFYNTYEEALEKGLQEALKLI